VNTEYNKYTYYYNFNKYIDLLEDYNNINLKLFMTASNLKEKSKSIFKVLFYHDSEYEEKKIVVTTL
jgi:hypothetical protein